MFQEDEHTGTSPQLKVCFRTKHWVTAPNNWSTEEHASDLDPLLEQETLLSSLAEDRITQITLMECGGRMGEEQNGENLSESNWRDPYLREYTRDTQRWG